MQLPSDRWICVWRAWVAAQINILVIVDANGLVYRLRKLPDSVTEVRKQASAHFISAFRVCDFCVLWCWPGLCEVKVDLPPSTRYK